ncbi:phage tail assembly chaperone [Amorphus sp. 3PC139-8]|uniref:phage tail assembly chaperone n=1 Tax=Amorphus sp. 3PC139-8 TaxID=2735676 RepID=UPI00345D793F
MRAAAGDPVAAFPWRAAMAVAIGRRGLAPEAFWRLTLRELRAVLAPERTAPAADVGRLRALIGAAEQTDQ